MLKYFGTDGFRGSANKDLMVHHAYQIGRYVGWYYGKNHKCRVVIGKDTRLSGYMLEAALVSGLTASGADAYLLHVVTTPGVAYITKLDEFDCGIMISASHNPYNDNGIKLLNDQGEKMDDAMLKRIEDYIDGLSDEIPLATDDNIGRSIDYYAGRNRYIGYLITLATHSYRGLNVGLDCANGSTWMIAKSVFDTLGATTHVINNTPNGTNINKYCGSTHIEGLQELVKEKGLDVGFAFDGDADRCLAVDEKGEVVDGDAILYICGTHMKRKDTLTNDTVVATIMSNMGLFKALEANGIKCEQTAVGDRFVYENMRENGHILGGEQSGHIIFGKYASTGDGLITAIKIMQVMLDRKMKLSELREGLTVYPQVNKNAKVKDKDETMNHPAVQEAAAKVREELGTEGRLVLRKSGTEKVVRVMVEHSSEDVCLEKVNYIINVMKENGLMA